MSRGEGDTGHADDQAMVYCLLPADLALALHDPLRAHFRDDPAVEVVVERREGERRGGGERRDTGDAAEPPAAERRQVRAPQGRRVGERRAAIVPVAEAPELPRRARRHADRIAFVERVEPPTQHAEDLDTARLVARFQGGDKEAFATLYTRYFDRVYSYLRVMLRQREEAEDAAQQVFARLFEKLAEQRLTRPFRAWLMTVVRNQAIDELRRSKRIQLEADPAARREREPAAGDITPAPVLNPALDWLTDRDLLVLFERLPLAQRQVLLLRYLLDLDTAETARILGRSNDDVRALQHRAVCFMRQRLTALGREAPDRRRTRMRIYAPQAYVLRKRRFALLGR